MKKLLIFAGTTEGRLLTVRALELGWCVASAVATEYGRELLPHDARFTALAGRMTEDEMYAHIQSERYDMVVDATHPYAVEVSRNIRSACARVGVRLLRLLREESKACGCRYFETLAQACRAANEAQGAILAATGSKQIAQYAAVANWKTRVYARVLPTGESVALCRAAGLPDDHILAAKGPFSYEDNVKVMQKYAIRLLITKDGGKEGGFLDKIRAAQDCKAEVFVLARPEETGVCYEQVVRMLKEER